MKKNILLFCFSILSASVLAQSDESSWALKIMPLSFLDINSTFQVGVTRNFKSGNTLELDCGVHYFNGPFDKHHAYEHHSNAVKLKLSFSHQFKWLGVTLSPRIEWIYKKTLNGPGSYLYKGGECYGYGIYTFQSGVIEQNVFIIDPLGVSSKIYSQNNFFIDCFAAFGFRLSFSGLYDFTGLNRPDLGTDGQYLVNLFPTMRLDGWSRFPDLQLGLRFCFQFKHRA